MYSLSVETDFSAAHQLREYQGKCENLHGHNWRVRLTVEGSKLDKAGMLIDFGELKRILGECTGRLDHKFLNELPPWDNTNPTSENLARYLAAAVAALLPAGVKVEAMEIWESEKCSAIYRP